jgi:diaminopimelate epimerase
MTSKSGQIEFTKLVASGNDFVVIEDLPGYTTHRYQQLARIICRRMFSVGADGLLVVGASARADISMRVFNADGSEADMCGNGARCVALHEAHKRRKTDIDIQTRAGIVSSVVDGNNVKIKLTDPRGLTFDIALPLARRKIRVNFINTGVPHTVVFVHGLDKIDVILSR